MSKALIDALTDSTEPQLSDAIAACVDGTMSKEQETFLRQKISSLGFDPDWGLDAIRVFAESGGQNYAPPPPPPPQTAPPIQKFARDGFHPEVEKLMSHALTDGVLTNSEIEVVRKKAIALGDDPDEVIMVLESKMHKVQADQSKAKKPSGVCPSCGDMIKGLSRVCPSCGYMLEDGVAPSSGELEKSISELEEIIVKLNGYPKESLSGYLWKAFKAYLIITFTLGLYWLFKRSKKDEGDWDATVIRARQAIRRIKLKFGEEPQVKRLLSELESEMNTEIEVREKAKRGARIGVAVVVVLFLFMALIGGE